MLLSRCSSSSKSPPVLYLMMCVISVHKNKDSHKMTFFFFSLVHFGLDGVVSLMCHICKGGEGFCKKTQF